MILSNDAILKELEYQMENNSITDFLESGDDFLNQLLLEDEEYNKVTNRLQLEILDVERFVKVNDCKCVSDARAFSSNNIPTDNGLLSNEIFGYTSTERAGTFGYIDLHGWFIDPSCYKTWTNIDNRIKNIAAGIKYYRIDEHGELVEDEERGNTGLDWLHKNMNKIKFKSNVTESKKISLKYLQDNRDKMWINKYIVIPPLYRDKNSDSNSRATVGLGDVNKLYQNLIVASNGLTANQEYGFDSSDEMKFRVQSILLQLYNFFSGNGEFENKGLSKKLGYMRRAAMSKTADFSSRLVISPVDLKADRPEDLMVSYDKAALPLYSAMTQFRDFVMFNVREFFENEFVGSATYPVIDSNGNMKAVYPEDPEIVFGDDRISIEMDRFLHGYNNRFIPVEIPVEGTDEKFYMGYKGRNRDPKNPENVELAKRRLTWCDIFYLATVEAVKDKHIIITRFPIDFFSNQFTTKIEVASTRETEEVEYNGVIYKWYPKIREEDIGKDTSNSFIDTLRFSNLYLTSIGGDYDGDQVTCKGVYTREANDELDRFMNDKQNFINFGATPLKEPGSDSIQALYGLTKILSTVKVTPSESIEYK